MTLKNAKLLIALAIVGYLYFPLNRPWGDVHIVALPIDDRIPLLPSFVIPYLLYIPFLYATILYVAFFHNKFGPIAYSFLITWVICYLVYMTFQTTIIRPQLDPNDESIFIRLVAMVYEMDRPYNCLPSLHSANAVLCLFSFQNVNKRAVIWVAPLVATIIASTVLIKQHYLADTLTGALLAGIVFWSVHRTSGTEDEDVSIMPRLERENR